MIYPVKVYTRQGLRKRLRFDPKKSLDAKKAIEHFDICKRSGRKIFEMNERESIYFSTSDQDDATLQIEKLKVDAQHAKWVNKGRPRLYRKKRVKLHKVICPLCGKKAKRKSINAVYCSDKCQTKMKNIRQIKQRTSLKKAQQELREKRMLWKKSLIIGLAKIVDVLNGKTRIIASAILPRAKKGE